MKIYSILLLAGFFAPGMLLAGDSIIVAKDGSGKYSTVQAAFDAIPRNNNTPVVIFIRNGVYKEKLLLDSSKSFVTLKGEDKFNTILTYDDHSGKIDPQGRTINTHTSASFFMLADNFSAYDITFGNNAGFSAGQAVAIQANGDEAKFINCRFLGFQDVLFTNNPGSRQFYYNCYIEGTTDFIFGSSTVWFERCHIHSKKESHITAASTPQENTFGYVFYDCVFTGDTTLNHVSLGRPWRPYSSVTYLHCYLGKHILPEGWNNWGKPANEATARYAEYRNYGPGAQPDQRANWSRQLTADDAKKYRQEEVLSGWTPAMY